MNCPLPLLGVCLLVFFGFAEVEAAWNSSWTTLAASAAFDPLFGNQTSRFQSFYDPFREVIFYTNASSHSVRYWAGLRSGSAGSPATTRLASAGFVVGGLRSGIKDGTTCFPTSQPCEDALFDRPRGLSPWWGNPRKGVGIIGLQGMFVSDSPSNCIRFLSMRAWCDSGSAEQQPTGGATTASGSCSTRGHVAGVSAGLCHPVDGAKTVFGSPGLSRVTYPQQFATSNRFGHRVVLAGRCIMWLSVYDDSGNGRPVTLSTSWLAGGCATASSSSSSSSGVVFPGGNARDPASLVHAIAAAFSPDGDTLYVSDLAGPSGGIRKIFPANRVLPNGVGQIISGLIGLAAATTTTTPSVASTEAQNESTTTSTAPSSSSSSASPAGETVTSTTQTIAATPTTLLVQGAGGNEPNNTIILGLDILQDYTRPFLLVYSTKRTPFTKMAAGGPLPFGTLAGFANSTVLSSLPARGPLAADPVTAGGSEAWTININPIGIISATDRGTFLCRWPCLDVTQNQQQQQQPSSAPPYKGYSWKYREMKRGATLSPSALESRSMPLTNSHHLTHSKSRALTLTLPETWSGNKSTSSRSLTVVPAPPPPFIRGLSGASYVNGVFLFIGGIFYSDHWAAALALSRQRSTVRCVVLATLNRHRAQWTRGGRRSVVPWRQRVLSALSRKDPTNKNVRLYHDEDLEMRSPPFADSPTAMRSGSGWLWSQYLTGACIGNCIFAASFIVFLSAVTMFRLSRANAPVALERAERIKQRRRLGLSTAILKLVDSRQFPISIRDLLGRGGVVDSFVPFALAWLLPPTLSAAMVLCARDSTDSYGVRTFGIVFACVVPVVVLGLVVLVLGCRAAPRMEKWSEYVPDSVRLEMEAEARRRKENNGPNAMNAQEQQEQEEEEEEEEEVSGEEQDAAPAVVVNVSDDENSKSSKKKKSSGRATATRQQKQPNDNKKNSSAPSITVAEWLLVSRGTYELPPDFDDALLRKQEADAQRAAANATSSSSSSASSSDDDGTIEPAERRRQQLLKKNVCARRLEQQGNSSSPPGSKKSKSLLSPRNVHFSPNSPSSGVGDAAAAGLVAQLTEADETEMFGRVERRTNSAVEFYAALPLLRPYVPGCQGWMLSVDILSQLVLGVAEFVGVWWDDNVALMSYVVLAAVVMPCFVTVFASPYAARVGALQILISTLFQIPCLIIAILLDTEWMATEGDGGEGVVQAGNVAGGLMLLSACIVAILSIARWIAASIRPWWVQNEQKLAAKYNKRKEKRKAKREAALLQIENERMTEMMEMRRRGSSDSAIAMDSVGRRGSKSSSSGTAGGPSAAAAVENTLAARQAEVRKLYATPAYELDAETRRAVAMNRAKAIATVSGGGFGAALLKRKVAAAAAEKEDEDSQNNDDYGDHFSSFSSSPSSRSFSTLDPLRAAAARQKKQRAAAKHSFIDSDEEKELQAIRARVDIDKKQRKLEKLDPAKKQLFAQCEYPVALAALSDRDLEAFMPKAERMRRAREMWRDIGRVQQQREAEKWERLRYQRQREEEERDWPARQQSSVVSSAATSGAPALRSPTLSSQQRSAHSHRRRSVSFNHDDDQSFYDDSGSDCGTGSGRSDSSSNSDVSDDSLLDEKYNRRAAPPPDDFRYGML